MDFHEFVSGTVLRAGPREVSEAEIIEFARRYDPQPFHIDCDYAVSSRWGGLIASGWMTCAIAMELVVSNILAGTKSIGSPGVDELRWVHPVRPGDRLWLTVTVLESRVSSSGKTGIVRWRWELQNQADARVLSLVGISMFELALPPGK